MAHEIHLDGGAVEWPALVIHGGAGGYERVAGDVARTARITEGIDAALDAGWEVLEAGGEPVDAVVAAVRVLEDDGSFNAGRGSVPTTSGSVEMDASVMDDQARTGAVACITGFSAVAAARAVWAAGADRGDLEPGERVILLAGTEAESFAASHGVPRLGPLVPGGSADPPPLSSQGTVGAVAVSSDGRFAAATSTGGRPGQPPGRVGDTPIAGAGIWAQPGCAVSATGAGEAFVLAGFSRLVGTGHGAGLSLDDAMISALAEVVRYGGRGGAIGLGADRTWTAAYDTKAMARGLRHGGGRHRAIAD